jgi:hypothetical protein
VVENIALICSINIGGVRGGLTNRTTRHLHRRDEEQNHQCDPNPFPSTEKTP